MNGWDDIPFAEGVTLPPPLTAEEERLAALPQKTVTRRDSPTPRANAPTRPPWWTAADDAELAVLFREFIDGVFEHRERCAICSVGVGEPGWNWCDSLRAALEVIFEWRERRSLRSYATAMRTLQDQADLKTEAPGAANGKGAAA